MLNLTPHRFLPQPPTIYPALPTDPATLALWGDVVLADQLMSAAENGSPVWVERRKVHRDALANLLTLQLRGR